MSTSNQRAIGFSGSIGVIGDEKTRSGAKAKPKSPRRFFLARTGSAAGGGIGSMKHVAILEGHEPELARREPAGLPERSVERGKIVESGLVRDPADGLVRLQKP